MWVGVEEDTFVRGGVGEARGRSAGSVIKPRDAAGGVRHVEGGHGSRCRNGVRSS